MRLLPWSSDKKASQPKTVVVVQKTEEISYTTISGRVVRIQTSDIRNAPRYTTRFGRVTGIIKL